MEPCFEALCYKHQAVDLENAGAGNHAQVMIKYRRAISLDANNFSIIFQYASYLSRQKKYHEAGNMFKKAVMLNPRKTNTYIEWGNATFLAGEYDTSMDIFKRVLQIKPDMGLAYNNIGFILYSQQEFEKALASFEKAFALDTRQNIALFNCSLLLFHQDRVEEGIIKYKEGIKATEQGDYPVPELIQIYSVQVFHAEQKLKEKLDKYQREFLEAKLRGIQRIVQLLKDEGKQNIINFRELYNKEYEADMNVINSSPILKGYFESLSHYLTLLFSKIFEQDNRYVVNADFLADTILLCFEMNKSLKLNRITQLVEIEDENELRNKIIEFNSVPEGVFEPAITSGYLAELIEVMSQKLTLLRGTSLPEKDSELDQDKLPGVSRLIEFLEVKDIENRVEEIALLDSSILVLMCFLSDSDDKMDTVLGFIEEVCLKMQVIL